MSDVTPQDQGRADPDKPCPHANIEAGLTFEHLTTGDNVPVCRVMKVRAWCKDCEEPVRWRMEGVGFHPNMGTIEGFERLEARIPCEIIDSPLATPPRSTLWVPGMPR